MHGSQKFLICEHCGNMVGIIDFKGGPIDCCGSKMTELIPNTVDASTEKHLPVVSVAEGNVSVHIGAAPHPMADAHYIGFIYLETECGGQRKRLNPGEEAKAEFKLAGDEPVAAYCYCNLHGLWKTEL